SWMAAAGVRAASLFGGGALLTGLAAKQNNSHRLVQLIRNQLRDAVIASADDPRLESWLAFMASAAAISNAHHDRNVIHLDIGGGRTNLALGRARNVIDTGCWFVGARHVQVIPGTYRIVRLSPYAQQLFAHFGIAKGAGDELSKSELDAVLDFYVTVLESV